MNYRRALEAGGCYFFTVNLEDRSSYLLIEEIDLLRKCFREVKTKHPFKMNAAVVLPNHLHCIWTLPEGDFNYSKRWQLIKARFSAQIQQKESISTSRLLKGERGIWQRRFWEHQIRNERDLLKHIEYIHNNPVKHGFCTTVNEWKYSSAHQHT